MSRQAHFERMKRVEKYIENNLDKKLSVSELSTMACYSMFHFHRVFRAFTGENVYAYQKRLLLERSIKQLLLSEESITEIAYLAGYDSQPSYNKAFKNMFGTSPSHFRKYKLSITNFKNSNFEVKPMKVEIRTLKPIPVLSVRKRGGYQSAASEAWNSLMKHTYSNGLMSKDTQLIGIGHDDPSITEPDNIRYEACVTSDNPGNAAGEVAHHVIEGGKYAVVMHKGSYDNLSETYSMIYNQWLPDSDYKVREIPPFEIYHNRDPRRTKPENLRTEVHVPIIQG